MSYDRRLNLERKIYKAQQEKNDFNATPLSNYTSEKI